MRFVTSLNTTQSHKPPKLPQSHSHSYSNTIHDGATHSFLFRLSPFLTPYFSSHIFVSTEIKLLLLYIYGDG
ncbi:hypothetical protein L1887_07208 [Cichorium endivia]|nr:hypothetical protein L1887_07208 [Cichorium endivia]